MPLRRFAQGAAFAALLSCLGCHSGSQPAIKPTPQPSASACPTSAPLAGALIVTTLGDSGPGSLRATLATAPANSTIAFDASLAGQSIGLTSGPLFINASPIVIAGPCPAVTIAGTATGAGQHMLTIGTGVHATIDGLTLTSTNAPAIGVGSAARVFLNGVRIVGSTAPSCAALDASVADAQVAILNGSVVSGNTSGTDGILCNIGQLTIDRLTVSKNVTGGFGAVYNSGSGVTSIQSSVFDDNSAANGAAIAVAGGTVTAVNSTFYANAARQAGGAISVAGGSAALDYGTVSANASTSAQLTVAAPGTLTLHATITANKAASTPSDVAGAIASNGYNFVVSPGTATGFVPTDILGKTLSLFAFGNYGGPTSTLPPQAGSPVIDAGDPRNLECPFFDQRGVKRPQGSACDIGAVEYVFANPP